MVEANVIEKKKGTPCLIHFSLKSYGFASDSRKGGLCYAVS